ncbi:MAG: hypothetical protein SV253_00805 [Halobacteria archaeon]|nr:hypothetical protein [Halobacteria archaeon]
MSVNDWRVWKWKQHVCIACGESLSRDSFDIYYRDGNSENTELDNIDLVCPDCGDEIDYATHERGEVENVFEEIEEEMPSASPEEKTAEYLRRTQE